MRVGPSVGSTVADNGPRRTRRPELRSRWNDERPVSRPEAARNGTLGRDPGSALGSASLQNGASTSGGHTGTEAMLFRTTSDIGLKSTLHGGP